MNYSKQTIAQYNIRLNKFKKWNIDISKCTNAAVLYELLKSYKLSDIAIKMYLQAILWSGENTNDIFKKDLSEIITQISKDDKENRGNNLLERTQKDNFMEWPDILKVHEQLKLKHKINKKHFRDYLLVSLYVLFPPRRIDDYSSMVVIKGDDYKINKGLVKTEDENNYWLYDHRKFIFNRYKTNKKNIRKDDTVKTFFKQQTFEVPKDLNDIIKEYVDLFHISSGEKLLGLTVASLIINLKRIFKKYAGKSITGNILRHSFITHKLNSGKYNFNEMEIIARKMAHNINSQMQYYKNVDS